MKPHAAAFAKLSPPRLKGIYGRERLFAELDDLRSHPALWIAAPGGCGKTTLVASYLQARKLSCLWYQIDRGDVDLLSFFHHLEAAVERVAPRSHGPLPQLKPEHLTDLEAFTRILFREIAKRLDPDTVLVFDNVQDAGEKPEFLNVLRTGIEQLASPIHVMFLSRTDPPAGYARLRANRVLAYLSWHDLKLREEESAAIAKLLSRTGERNAIESDRLHRECEGWIAGLILLLEGARTRGRTGAKTDEIDTQVLFDYFAAEVFAHRPAPMQEFLLLTALFPSFTAAMAQQLTGAKETQAWLDDLVGHHHFTEWHAEPELVYQYHPLFRAFLRARARDAWSVGDMSSHVQTAARILESTAQHEQALALYFEDGDGASAARVISSHAHRLATTGRLDTLRAAITQLPLTLVEAQPWLRYWLGVSQLATDLLGARASFEQAYRAFRATRDARGCYLAWSGVIESSVFLWGEFKELRSWIDEFDSLRRDFAEFSDRAVEERATYAIFTAHVFAAPEWDAIGPWVVRAERLAHEAEDVSIRMMTIASLGLYYPWLGELARYEKVVEAARDLASNEAATPVARLNLLCMQSRTKPLYGDAQRARDLATEAAAVAHATGVHMLDRSIQSCLVYANAQLRAIEPAEGALEKYRTLIAPGMHLEEAQWLYMASVVAELGGNTERAYERGRNAFELAHRCSVPFAIIVCGLNFARLLARSGRLTQAQQLIENTLPIAQAIRSSLFESECFLLRAWLGLRTSDRETCVDNLRAALTRAEEFGFRAYVGWNPQWLAELAAIAIKEGICVETARSLIRVNRLVPDESIDASGAWPWPVKVRTLGAFVLEVRDEPVRFGAKAQKKPLELLHALIALGGRAVPVGEITERLWPDSDGDAAHRAFDTTLHRLRRLLDSDEAVFVEGGRVTLDAHHVWVDAWAFERAATRANGEVSLEHAVALYRGAFLGRDAMTWVLPMRERLRSMFLRTIEQLGSLYEQSDRPSAAIECYRRGIEADPLAESLYLRLMLCFEQLNRHSEAVAMYERLRTMLHSQLGVEPSSRSQELHRRLLA